MEKIFLEILRLSMLSGGMALAVLVIRLLLRRAPKSLHCFLWMLVGIRLLIPFSIESVFGLFPQQRVLEERVFNASAGNIGVSTAGMSQIVPENKGQEMPLAGTLQSGNSERQSALSGNEGMQWALQAGAWIWCMGMLLMAACFLYSWVKLKVCVRDSESTVYSIKTYDKEADFEDICSTESCCAEKNQIRILLCKGIETPFLFGILHPEIYVPLHMDEENLPYIIRHELSHKKRRDYLVKPAAFFLLAVHWFNPCIWLAYKMLCRDMELACDEMVIRDMEVKDRKAYSRALLNCSVWQEKAAACPVAFGEPGVKKRIKNILNYKKPTVLAACFGVILCMVLLFCFMTQRKAGGGQTVLLANEAGGSGETGNAAGENIQELKEAESLAYVKEWADAFCDRSGKKLVSLCSVKVLETFGEEEMLITEDGEDPGFGWSSPWPRDSEVDYRIVDMTDNTARVLYYAWTSDPHVTVWEESIAWHVEGEQYLIDSSELTFRDNLCSGEEFYSAYPEGIISGTRMDYSDNGAGEALNENAKANRESYETFYGPLFAPDTAARFLLNLLNNDEKVKITVEEEGEGKAQVSIEFILDHTQVHVTMVQPYGEDGIWIPQTWEG